MYHMPQLTKCTPVTCITLYMIYVPMPASITSAMIWCSSEFIGQCEVFLLDQTSLPPLHKMRKLGLAARLE